MEPYEATEKNEEDFVKEHVVIFQDILLNGKIAKCTKNISMWNKIYMCKTKYACTYFKRNRILSMHL